jgi:hypothetical protein
MCGAAAGNPWEMLGAAFLVAQIIDPDRLLFMAD